MAETAEEQAEELQTDILVLIAEALAAGALIASGAFMLRSKVNQLIAKRLPNITKAAQNELADAFVSNANIQSSGRKFDVWRDSTLRANARAQAFGKWLNGGLATMSNDANAQYLRAAFNAGVRAGQVGRVQALREAVHDLANKGISCSTYTRKDGVQVRVPVDVGVRRMINDEMRQGQLDQTLYIAEKVGDGLVRVNTTANCRESHAVWQGQIYSLTQGHPQYAYFYSACHYGDPVIGIGGYNCGHRAEVYYEGRPSHFTDPLEGTGLTTEEAREIVTEQRKLQNTIRKTKREIEMLKAAGIDTAGERKRLQIKQDEVKALVNTYPDLLRRHEKYWERK